MMEKVESAIILVSILAISFMISFAFGSCARIYFFEKAHAEAPVTYADVAPVLNNVCGSCHGEHNRSLPQFDTYEKAFAIKERIYQKVVVEGTMPKYGLEFPNDIKKLFKAWIKQGARDDKSKDFYGDL